MLKKATVLLIIALLCSSTFVILSSVQPARADTWTTVNNNPNIDGSAGYPYSWDPTSWYREQEGSSISAYHEMYGGIATTQLFTYADSYPGEQIWDAAGFKQDIDQGAAWASPYSSGVPATMQQKVAYNVRPNYEDVTGYSYFDAFIEVWVKFDSGVGNQDLNVAELMLKLRVIVNGPSPDPVDYYQFDTPSASWGTWYLATNAVENIPYAQWTSGDMNINDWLNALQANFGISNNELSTGKTFSIIFGIEGYSTTGVMGAEWDYVNLEVNSDSTEYVSSILSYDHWGSQACNVFNPNGLTGSQNDGQFVQLYAGNYGDVAQIVGQMNTATQGNIYLYGYSAPGYNSHLYVYVWDDGNWDFVNDLWISTNDPYSIDVGQSPAAFTQIALVSYDDSGMSSNIFIDSVAVS